MIYSFIATAATLLSMASSVVAAGTAHVVNNCGTEVYFASVAANGNAGMQPLGGGYSQAYSQPGIGVSIKLSPNATGAVTQFEFTWADGNIAYDISNIDGNPFAHGGMTLTPSMAGASGYPTCAVVNCPAGQASCSAAYNAPDDVRTMVCPEASDLTMVLCSGGPLKRDEPMREESKRDETQYLGQAHRVHARQWR